MMMKMKLMMRLIMIFFSKLVNRIVVIVMMNGMNCV